MSLTHQGLGEGGDSLLPITSTSILYRMLSVDLSSPNSGWQVCETICTCDSLFGVSFNDKRCTVIGLVVSGFPMI